MKKIIALMLCLIMLFSLVACVDDGDGDATTTTTTTTTEQSTTTTTVGTDVDRLTYHEWDKDGYHIYVSESGRDYNDGTTPEKSVQSIYRANELASNYINSDTPDKQDVIISFEKGTYYISSTVSVPSGTEDVGVYYTSRGGRASFIGGLNIKPYEIKKCTDSAVLNKVFDETARKNLYAIDLTSYTPYLTTLFGDIEFYAGDYNLQPSRFPDKDHQVSDNAAMGIDMPGAFAVAHINYMKNGSFVSIAEIGSEFSTTPINIFIRGETYERVKSWDVENEKIYIEDTLNNNYTVTRHYVTDFTDSRYSFNGNITFFDGYITLNTGRGSNGNIGTISDGGSSSEFRRAYFFNILEEINDPGEYYYDEENKKLYVYLDETMPTDDLYIATLTSRAINISGSSNNLARNVHFVNVEFKYSQSDWFNIANATDISVTGCIVGLNAGAAVYTSNATALTFKDSVFEATGKGVFWLSNTAWGDHDEDGVFDLANVLVENCIIHDISEQKVDYYPAFHFSNFSGLTVRKCTISEGGHAAVQYTNAANLLFEYNEWSDFMTETDDGGLSYSGMHDVTTMTGIVWRYNLIHDIGSSWQPWNVRVFYSDADSSLYTIHDNIIYNFMKGDTKGMVFHNVHGANIYNNIIMNTSARTQVMTEYTSRDNGTDLMRSLRTDTVSDSYNGTFYYLKYEGSTGEDTLGLTDARRALYSSGLLDDDFNFTFERFQYLRSDEFLYEMLSKGYAVMNPYNMSGDSRPVGLSESIYNGGTIAIDEETIADFRVRLTQSIAGKSAGDYDFDSVDEMTRFLVSVGYKGDSDVSRFPDGVELLYRGQQVCHFYFNLLAPNSPKAISEWVLSEAATVRSATDATITNNIDTLFSEHRGWAHYVYRAAIYSKVAYTGLYYNNLTINVGVDHSYEIMLGNKIVYWDSAFAKNSNNSDYDGLDIELLDENGEYTVEFIDTIGDILYNDPNLLFDNEGEPVLQLLDLSKVGASLKIN